MEVVFELSDENTEGKTEAWRSENRLEREAWTGKNRLEMLLFSPRKCVSIHAALSS